MRHFKRTSAFAAGLAFTTVISLAACIPEPPVGPGPPPSPAPTTTVPQTLNIVTVNGIQVDYQIAGLVALMQFNAKADGVTLMGSGYRTAAEQIELRKEHCGTSDYAIYQMPSSQCIPPTAIPGHSMHEVGLAIDWWNSSTHETVVFQWLATHAAAYGFYNLPSEPWHWSTNGH